MKATTKAATSSAATTKRRVEPLANTPYSVRNETDLGVVLCNGKALELWRRVAKPLKGYAIQIDGLAGKNGQHQVFGTAVMDELYLKTIRLDDRPERWRKAVEA